MNEELPQKSSFSLINLIIILIVFVGVIALLSGSINNILNSIVSSSDMFFKIAVAMVVLGIIGWIIFKGNFNLLQNKPKEIREIFPEAVKYFKEVYEINFVPFPHEWEGARLDPIYSTYVVVMHFNFLKNHVVSKEHDLFAPDVILRWDAVENKPIGQPRPLNMDISRDANGFPLEQGKEMQLGFEKARLKQITTD